MLGSKIYSCFEFVDKVGQEVDHLSNLVMGEVSRMLAEPEMARKFGTYSWGAWVRNSKSDWICSDVIYDLPLILKPKRNAELFLGFQISLLGDGVETGGNRVPLLHVFCWRNGPAALANSLMTFPLEPGAQAIEDRSLFVLSGKPGAQRSWVYSLDLTAVNTISDVQRLIILPMSKLLLGGSEKVAFRGVVCGVASYAEIDDEPGHYLIGFDEK